MFHLSFLPSHLILFVSVKHLCSFSFFLFNVPSLYFYCNETQWWEKLVNRIKTRNCDWNSANKWRTSMNRMRVQKWWLKFRRIFHFCPKENCILKPSFLLNLNFDPECRYLFSFSSYFIFILIPLCYFVFQLNSYFC